MKHNEILFLCHSNPKAVLDYIKSLETELNKVKIESNEFKAELNEVKTELNDAKEEIRNLKALLNQHRVEIKKCPYRLSQNKADFPKHLTKPVQYSKRVLAIAVYLRDFQLIPFARIS